MPKQSNRIVGCNDPVVCQICGKKCSTPLNLKKHIKNMHKPFLKYREKAEGVNSDTALARTYENHVMKNEKVPEALIEKYKEKLIPSYFKKVGATGDEARTGASGSILQLRENENPFPSTMSFAGDSSSLNITQEPEVQNEAAKVDPDISSLAIESNDDKEMPKSPMIVTTTTANKSTTSTTASTTIAATTTSTVSDKPTTVASCRQPRQSIIQVECQGCVHLNELFGLHQAVFKKHCKKVIDTHCLCSKKEKCCCQTKLHKMLKTQDEVPGSDTMKDLKEEFFCKDEKGVLKWYCLTCHRYSSKRVKQNFQDWHMKGSSFSDISKLHDGMKKHLQSNDHKMSNSRAKSDKTINVTSQTKLAPKCTENLCTAGQFVASHNLSQRFFPSLCQFIGIINTNTSSDTGNLVHPLGNQHQSKSAIKEAQIACYEAAREKMANEDKDISVTTGLQPRYMVSFDKGTVHKDSQRQAIVMTKVNKEGMPKDYLISTSVIKDTTAQGACNHITKEASKLITTKNIALVCSDNEAVYAGCISGVAERMKVSEQYSNRVIRLEDVCHNVERMMFPANPEPEEDWVLDTIRKCNSLINSVLSQPTISKFLKSYELEEIEEGVKFHIFQKHSKTRFTEFAHISFSSILKNIEILYKALPTVIHETSKFDSLTKDTTRGILHLIADPVFLARILLLDSVFIPVSRMEKEAQSEKFGPFEFLKIRKDLKDTLHNLKKHGLNAVKQMVDKGIFAYSFLQNKKKHKVHIDLNSLEVITRPSRTPMSGQDCWTQYIQWLDILLNRFDDYVKVPDVISAGANAFSLPDHPITEEQLKEKTEQFRSFFQLVNTEYELCDETNCAGLACDCVSSQVGKYFAHAMTVKDNFKSQKGIDYVKLFSYFLSESRSPEVCNLKIRNIVRAMEVMQLLKASQSATERVVSQVNRTVKGRFENVYRFGDVRKYDMVNITVFLKMNSSILKMNASLARQKFLGMGHQEALKKTKPVYSKSLTVKRMFAEQDATHKPVKRPKLNPCTLIPLQDSVDLPDSPDDPEFLPEFIALSQDISEGPIQEYKEKIDRHINDAENSSKQTSDSMRENNLTQNSKEPKYCHDKCSAPTDLSKWWWVGCKYAKKCVSRKKRYDELGVGGGDWFHSVCVGVVRKHRKNEHWVCSNCYEEQLEEISKRVKQKKKEASKSVIDIKPINCLRKDLEKENRTIRKVNGDGNCLYRAFAYHNFGNDFMHETVRKTMCDQLINIYTKHKNRWSIDTCPQGEELKNDELYFIYKLVNHLRYEISEKCGESREISMENLSDYVNKKKEPHSHRDYGTEKWGGIIELHLHALLNQKNVWLISECVDRSGNILGYRVERTVSYKSRHHFSHIEDISRNYDMLFWEASKKHYSPIVTMKNKASPRPVCRKVFNYSGTIPLSPCDYCIDGGVQ